MVQYDHIFFLDFFQLALTNLKGIMDKDSGKDYLIAFGKHVTKIRESKGLSLREVAQLCDLDHSNIAKIEKGQKNCQLLTLVELATGLGVEPKELLDIEL